jgi:hypothetical protein
MDLKNFATLALLGYTIAAPAGVMNAEWPLWAAADRVTIPAAGGVNTFTIASIGSYPVGCLRSSGMVRFSQNMDGNAAAIVNRVALTSQSAMAFWGTTAAHTGTFIGGAATTATTSSIDSFTSTIGTFP